MSYRREVVELARPFPARYVKDDGRGNDHVPHHIVQQRLIRIFGAPPKIELLREIYDGDKLTGVVMRLTVPGFEPVEEAGDTDNPQSKTNGSRLKDASSDALKRCAMRLGLGLHLWSQKDYYLYDAIKEQGESASAEPQAGAAPSLTVTSPSPAPASRQPSDDGGFFDAG
jgi:hypothetical protein